MTYLDTKRRRKQMAEAYTNEDKIVRYDRYCKTCLNKDLKQDEEPCNECLNNPTNGYSRKPVKYEKKVSKNTRGAV